MEHSSESGVTIGVGVVLPGRKNVSRPSCKSDVDASSITSVGGRTWGRVGARVFGFLGRAFPKCLSCWGETGGSSKKKIETFKIIT